MARLAVDDDWEDDEAGSSEEDAPSVPCPYCSKPMYEDAPRCPSCGKYVSDEDAPAERKPWWIVVGALLCFYAVYRWIVG